MTPSPTKAPSDSTLVAKSAEGSTIQSADGRRVLDFASGCFGYGVPSITSRLAEQIQSLPLSSRLFLSLPLARVVQRLAELAPGDLEVSYLCNSGAEAIEGAVKLARAFHRRRDHFVALEGSYHGSTMGALSLCGIPGVRHSFPILPISTEFMPFGDVEALNTVVTTRTVAVVIEPILSCIGVVIPAPGYMAALRARCDATGALLIVDEIATGLGRTGRRFAVDEDGVVPDVLVIGGVLGGGVVPVAAYITRRSINDRVYGKREPALHGSTTGGNPAACVAALACLDMIEEQELIPRAMELGRTLLQALHEIQRIHADEIVHVAGRGLLTGMCVADRETAVAVRYEALRRGVLVRAEGDTEGPGWVGVRPPLIVTEVDLDVGLRRLAESVAAVFSGVRS